MMCSRGGEHDFSNGDHSLFVHRLAYNRERLSANITVRDEIIWVIEIQLVYLILGHELVDLDSALAFKRNRLELFWIDLQALPLTDFVAFDDVGRLDFITGLSIDSNWLDCGRWLGIWLHAELQRSD
jgi:hypothetical protein